MTDKLWKQNERKIAEILGGRRVPITGRQRGDAPDIEHGWLSIEVKEREIVPSWIRVAMAQAVAARTTDKLPIAVIHQKNTRHDGDLVIMRLSDFVAWFGGKEEK